jgi:hypothetical protein
LVTFHIPQVSTPLSMRCATFSKNREEHMKGRSILSISAMTVLGLAVLPGSAVAQQGTLKQQLVGTWTLVSCENQVNGIRQPNCVNPSGSLSLDASGRYTLAHLARGRPKATTTGAQNRADVTPDYYKAIAQGVVAQFGTWSVSEADKTLTRKVEGALFPNGEGTEGKTTVSLAGDELKLTATNPAGVRTDTVYRRAR